MKLVHQYPGPFSKDRHFDVAEAAETSCTGWGGESGQIESLRDDLRDTHKFIGRLTQMLFDKGHLTNDQILELCPLFMEVK